MTETKVTKSRRGRKKISEGGTSSPRKIICSCAAIVDGELVHELIQAVSCTKDSTDEDIYSEVSALFEDKYGITPSMSKPLYDKNSVSKSKKQRDTVSISMEDLIFDDNKEVQTAVYKDWNVKLRFIKNTDEAAYVIFQGHVSEEKKNKPSNKVIRLSALENIQTV